MISGIHHLGLTVRDVDASAAWYQEVLGFRRDGEFESADGARRKVFLRHDGVADREELAEWTDRLSAAAVTHSPVAAAD
jgi:glyoxylase I family protein